MKNKGITIYTTRYCGYCVQAKRLLDSKNVTYSEIAVDGDTQARAELMNKSGRSTVPQIWLYGKHVGGCDDLYALERSGQLDKILAEG